MIDLLEDGQVALLRGLLERYSPSNYEGEATAWLAAQMKGLGFKTRIDTAGNVTGTRGAGEKELLLLGHIDTVSGMIPVEQKEGRLYGRGAVDAKGSLAAMISAAALAEIRPGWRITVTGAVGEESDARGARALAEGPAPAAVVIGEPSGWERVTLGYKGSAWVDLSYQRPLTHGAARAENAPQAAINFWNRVVLACQTYNNGRERVFDQLTPSVRSMNSGNDGFIETASLQMNFRLPEGLSRADLEVMLEGARKAGAADSQAGLRLYDFDPAFRCEKNSVLVRAFLPAIREQGGKPAFVFKSGTSDMNVVGPVWNCPILAYGPGDSNLDHTPEEHIQVGEYLKGVEVLRRAIGRIFDF